MRNKPYSLALILLLPFMAFSQSYLYLERSGEVPDQRWKQGDKIEILLFNGEEEVWKQGYFMGGDSSGLSLGTRFIEFNRIQGIRYANGIMPLLGKAALYGSFMFTGVFIVNGVINNDSPIIRPEPLITGGILLGLGLISKPYWYTERRMEEGYRFKVINMAHMEP